MLNNIRISGACPVVFIAIMLIALVTSAGQERSHKTMNNNDMSSVWSLPIDQTSPSSMVSATHLILFRLDSLQKGASTVAPDGSTSHDLILRVRVENIFKGHLQETKDSVTTLSIRQEGLSPISEGPPPAIDSESLISGTSYLLNAVGPADAKLVDLFSEGSARGIYSADYALDARLAQSAEQRFMHGNSDKAHALELLLSDAETHRSELHDLFGEYLWLQITPWLATDRDCTMERLLNIALNNESQWSFAIALLAEFDTLALDLENAPEVLQNLAQSYVVSLSKPLPARVIEFIATENLYNIVFNENDKPTGSFSAFGISPSAAADARNSIRTINDERAIAVADWLQ
ncbi:MAG: hypothetical protein GY799_30505 [Desulfobulbaceae bacterium]|nr:hypothetical protein [Desulfobulbaceae bacterium]